MALPTDVPLEVVEISTRGLSPTDERLARALVEEYATKMLRISSQIIGCHVAIERPQRYQDAGNPYRVRVRVTAPGHTEIVVVKDTGQHEMHDSLRKVIKDAFKVAKRQLDEELDKRRGRVKNHDQVPIDEDAQPATGFVVRLHREYDFGFLRTDDGREIYFHRNAVLDHGFDDLRLGSECRFEAEQGEDGPQATSVRILSQHGAMHEPQGVIDDPQGWRRDET